MTNNQLQGLILFNAQTIADAISTGAGWEIWFQVQLTLWLRAANAQAAREVPYPPPNGGLSLDILAQDYLGQYAIELKVESATNAGAQIINGINADILKIQQYPQPNPGDRWVVGLGYSVTALQAMQNFANNNANNVIFAVNNGIGVLIATV